MITHAISLPTGVGRTQLIAAAARKYVAENNLPERIIIMCRPEMVPQWLKELPNALCVSPRSENKLQESKHLLIFEGHLTRYHIDLFERIACPVWVTENASKLFGNPEVTFWGLDQLKQPPAPKQPVQCMNELQAMAVAALDTIKNDEGAELARLHKALHRAKFGVSDKGEVEEAHSALGEAEARHRRICDAIDWLKAIPQLDHMTTHKAAELRRQGYRDVGVVLQDEIGSTAVIAHGKVTWTEPNLINQERFEAMVREKFPRLSLKMTSRYNYVDSEVSSMWDGYTMATEMTSHKNAAVPTQNHVANVNEMVQTAQQPVAWMDRCGAVIGERVTGLEKQMYTIPLYLAPQQPDYYVSEQHGELKASYTDESDPAYKWVPVVALSKVAP